MRPCSTCGEPLPSDPGAHVLSCDACGTELHGRPALKRLVDPDWTALPPKAKLRYADDTPQALTAPEAIVPFRVDRAAARRILRDWARRGPFAPRAFRRLDESESFRGAYLPFWVWRADTRSRYKAARGEYEWAKGGSGRVRGVKWFPAAGAVDRAFAAVPVAATVRLEGAALADLLRDWSLEAAVAFEPGMLEGYWTQGFDLEPEVGLELAKARMAAEVEREVRARVGGDEQHVPVIDTVYAGLGYRLVLLPAWLVSYAHRGRRRMVAVHGESGRVVGERPQSGVKLVFAAALMLGVAGAILYFGILSLSSSSQGPLGGRGNKHVMYMLYGSWDAARPAELRALPPSAPATPCGRLDTPPTFRETQWAAR